MHSYTSTHWIMILLTASCVPFSIFTHQEQIFGLCLWMRMIWWDTLIIKERKKKLWYLLSLKLSRNVQMTRNVWSLIQKVTLACGKALCDMSFDELKGQAMQTLSESDSCWFALTKDLIVAVQISCLFLWNDMCSSFVLKEEIIWFSI